MYDFTLDELENSSKFKSLPLEDRSGIARLYVEKKGPDEAIAKFQKIASDPEFQSLPTTDRESFLKSFTDFYGIDVTDVTDGAVSRGLTKAKSSAQFGVEMTRAAATGDYSGAAANIVDLIDYIATNPGSKEGNDLMAAWESGDGVMGGVSNVLGKMGQDIGNAPSVWEAVKAAGRNLQAMGGGIVEQMPNMVAPMAGMGVGALAGSTVGPLGTIGGTFAGASAGNALVEGQGIAIEKMRKAGVDVTDAGQVAQFLEANAKELFGDTLAKGSIIGAIDTATMGIAGKLLNGPARAATARVLADMGVDFTDKAAVKTALTSQDFAAKLAADSAYIASQKGAGNIARHTAAAALEPAGEFSGDLFGNRAATGEWDTKGAALEAVSSIGQSGATFAGQKAYQLATRPPLSLKDAQTIAGNIPLNADPEAVAQQIEAATGDTAAAVPDVNFPGLNLADLTQEDVEDIAALSQRIARADLGQLQQLSAAVPTLRERRPTIAPHIENILSERIGQLNAQAGRAMQQQVPAFDQTAEQVYQDDLMDDWGDSEADVQQQTDARGRRQGFERLKEDLVTRTLNQESLAANRTGRPSTAEEAAAAFEEVGQTETMAETEQRLARREDAEAAFADKNVMLPRDIADAIVKMESDLRQGEKNTVIVEGQGNNQGVIGGAPSTNPEWFKAKTIQAYDKQHGTEYAKNVTKDAIFSALDKIRSGQKLTTKRERMSLAYLRIAAEQEVGRDPELIAGNEFANLEQEGFEFESPRQIAVGDLKKGDQVVVLGKNGVPDKLTHKGRDKSGNIVLQDGVRMEVDEFDVIHDVIALKESSPTTAPSTVGENQGGPPQAALGSRFDDAIPSSEKNYAQKQGQLDGVKRIATSGEVDQEVSGKPARDIGAGIVFDQAPGRLIVGGRKNGAGEEGPGADAKRRGYDDIPRTTAVDNPDSIANGQEVNQPPQQVSTSGAGEQNTAPPADQPKEQAKQQATAPPTPLDTKRTQDTPDGVATDGARPLEQQDKFASNKLFTSSAIEAAKARLAAKRNTLRSGFDPELLQDMLIVGGGHFEAGIRKFGDWARAVIADIGREFAPFLRGTYENLRYYPGLDTKGMSTAQEVDRDLTDVLLEDMIEEKGGKTNVAELGSNTNLERDRGDAGTRNEVGQDGVPARRGEDERTDQQGVPGTERARPAVRGDQGVSGPETAASGKRGDISPYSENRRSVSEERASGSDNDRRGGDVGQPRPTTDPQAARAVEQTAVGRPGLASKIAAQKAANRTTTVKVGDRANISETLPLLHKQQQDDVAFAEKRFAKPDGRGVLFTNGTGTGKTFSALGIIKRFEKQGKKNILVIAPDDLIIQTWTDAAGMFDLRMTRLADTKDGGSGIVITTYANFGANQALAKRKWDLVVADESHQLSMNKDGDTTAALAMLRAITLHPRGDYHLAKNRHSVLYERFEDAFAKLNEAKKNKASQREIDILENKALIHKTAWEKSLANVREEVKTTPPENKPRVVFLSATPFAYEKNIDLAEGYLFDYPEDGYIGNSRQGGFEKFMVENFGYRIRYHKLTEPDKNVNRGIMQRQFNAKLKKEGVLSSRVLDVDFDYDRKFALVESAIGQKIDEGMEFLWNSKRYRVLHEKMQERFDYLSRRYLLESIKAKEVVPIIKEHLAFGRKVVVFHDYIKGGGFNPFDFSGDRSNREKTNIAEYGQPENKVEIGQLVRDFETERPDLANLPLDNLYSPVNTLQAAFPDLLVVNGQTVTKNEGRENVKRFNDDETGPAVLLVQSDKDKGWSGHDTTGKHPRVLINLGLPTRPTRAIQQEGRIYRVGQASNAIFRYLNTGTNWERWAFASTIAQRASTAENLAMGEEARALLDSFVQGFEESDTYAPGFKGEGTGGKERDKASNAALTEWDRATTLYYSQLKKTSRTKAEEGKDYFATPEPLGLKMVEWANIRDGESVLEPSAGHGAIARWFPENTANTVVEPSSPLASRLKMVTDGKLVQDQFENFNIVNKFDAIVMNPPFGTGGKTAMDHIEKAAKHLRDGGRIVALVPAGPSMDKRIDKFLYGDDEKGKPLNPDMHLVASYRLPRVTFERAGTTVSARILIIDKMTDKDLAQKIQQRSERDYSGIENINEFFDRIKESAVPERIEIPGAVPEQGSDAGRPAAIGDEQIVEHTTQKGKIIRGVVRSGINKAEAQQIDPYTFKKDGGWFIREKYLSPPGDGTKLSVASSPISTAADIRAEITAKLGREATDALFDSGAVEMISPEEAERIAGKRSAAFHGSKFKGIEKTGGFSTSKIGTGEGAQAYGYGLYFASDRGVAEWYRTRLSGEISWEIRGKLFSKKIVSLEDFSTEAQQILGEHNFDPAAAIKALDIYDESYLARDRNILRELVDKKAKKVIGGQLYQVELAPEADEYLDWDRPLSEQSEKVKKALVKAGITGPVKLKNGMPLGSNGAKLRIENDPDLGPRYFMVTDDGGKFKLYKSDLENIVGVPDKEPFGKGIYTNIAAQKKTQQSASEYLHSLGIRGIRYLDGTSRSKGDGNHNYVIFNEEDVRIEKVFYSSSGQIQGITTGTGKVYLVDGGIKASKAWSVLLHEFGTHAGRLMTSSAEWRQLEKTVERRRSGSGEFGKLLREAYARIPKGTPAENVTEEAIAYLVENHPDVGIVRRVMALFKRALVKIGLSPDIFSAADLRALADIAVRRKAREAVSAGANVPREMRGVNEARPVMMSVAPATTPPATATRPDAIDRFLAKNPDLADAWERFVYGVIDKDDPRRRVMSRAAQVTAATDILTVERLRSKKTADEVEQFMENEVKPLLKHLATNKLAAKDLEEYAYAMHVPERNLRMRQVNAKGYIDAVAKHLNAEEGRALEDEMIDIRSDILVSGGTRAERQDKYLDVLSRLLDATERMRADLASEQDALDNRQFTPAEVAKNTPATLQNRLDKRAEHIGEIEKLRDRWERESVRYAGITDAEAQSIVDKWRRDPRFAAVQTAKEQLAAINQKKLDLLYESGQLSEAEYTSLTDGYQHYVPLHRDLEEDNRPATGRITGPTGHPLKVAKGSMLEVVNILAHSVRNTQAAIVRKHKAEAGRILYNFAKENPDAGIEVGKQKKNPTHDKEGNVVLYESPMEGQNELYVRVDGERYTLTFDTKDATTKRFLESIKEADVSIKGPMQLVAKMTRFLASVNTTLSPEFVISNFSRDIQTALAHLEDSSGKGLQGKVLRNTFPAIRGIFRAEFGNENTYWGRVYRDFAKNGGKIGWMQSYDTIKDLAKDLESTMQLYQKGHVPKKAFHAIGNAIGKTNLAIENGVRLATYDQLVKAGVSPAKAALEAANLTVDFTRRGSYSPTVNALYMFFNAGVQGNVRMLKAMHRSGKVKALVGGIIAAGFGLQMLGYAIGGDDDSDQPYIDGIPDHITERNMVIMKPGGNGEYIKIPMPYGYNGFFVMGSEIGKAMHAWMAGKKYAPGKGAARVGSTFMGSFNPLQSATIAQTLSPTIFDPAIMVSENKDAFGRDLMPKESPYGVNKADAFRHFKSVSTPAKQIAQALHRLTGGKGEYDTGAIVDISPETLDMWYDTATGSAGRFIKDTLMFPIDMATKEPGEKTDANKIPFVRRVYGEWSDRSISDRYYKKAEEIERIEKNYKTAPTKEEKIEIGKNPMFQAVGPFNQADKTLRKLREARDKAQAAGKPTTVIDQKIVRVQAEILKRSSQWEN